MVASAHGGILGFRYHCKDIFAVPYLMPWQGALPGLIEFRLSPMPSSDLLLKVRLNNANVLNGLPPYIDQ